MLGICSFIHHPKHQNTMQKTFKNWLRIKGSKFSLNTMQVHRTTYFINFVNVPYVVLIITQNNLFQ